MPDTSIPGEPNGILGIARRWILLGRSLKERWIADAGALRRLSSHE